MKIALVEDSSEERDALHSILCHAEKIACVGLFGDAETALAALPCLKPDVVLMDIQLPGMSGIDCIRELKPQLPNVRILILTVFEDYDRIFRSLKAGASGYLLKTTPPKKLIEAVRDLHSGGAPMSAPIARQVVEWFHASARTDPKIDTLSPREEEILQLLAKGFLYKEIADHLGLGVGTIRTYIRRIYEKLHVRSRTEAVLKILGDRP